MLPGLGRLNSIDPRNSKFPMAPALAGSTIPAPGFKVWAFPGTPLDQGATGTCVAQAAVHFIHASPNPHKTFLNPFKLYREIVLLDEYPGNDGEANAPSDSQLQYGSSGTGGAKALHKRGLTTGYLWASTMEEARKWVLTRGPVMFGGDWYSSMFNPTSEGFVKITPGSYVAGGHEWLLRGVSTRRGVAWGTNSWGPSWNPWNPSRKLRSGHFLIDFETLDKLFKDGGDVVSPIERVG